MLNKLCGLLLITTYVNKGKISSAPNSLFLIEFNFKIIKIFSSILLNKLIFSMGDFNNKS